MSEPVAHSHTIPVPLGMSPEEAWAEITTLGKLAYPPQNDDECGWANIECDGEECRGIEYSPSFQRFHNDVRIEAGFDHCPNNPCAFNECAGHGHCCAVSSHSASKR